MKPIAEIENELTTREFLRATCWYIYRGPLRFVSIAWPIFGFVLLVPALIEYGSKHDPSVFITPLLILAFLPGIPLLLAYWQFSRLKPHFKKARWEFFDDHVLIDFEVGESWLEWEAFELIAETRTSFLFFVSKQQFYVMPKRCIASSQDLLAVRKKIEGTLAARVPTK